MFKTLSAVLLAVSVVAAPALASTPGKTAFKPALKTEHVRPVKPNVLNANAKMGHRHVKHAHRYHHRSHKHAGAVKHHGFAVKHASPAPKRG